MQFLKRIIFELIVVNIFHPCNDFGGGGTGVGPSTQSTVVQSVQISSPLIFDP